MCAAAWVFTQAVQSAGGPEQQVIRVATHLVQVNVVVHDHKGAPVQGLTRDDFTILDGGKEEPISIFSVESGRSPKGPLGPLPPNVFSNRVAREGGTPTSVAVILLDGLHTTFWDLAYARQQLIKFLCQLQPQDRVALYFFGRRLSVVQDFTGDPSPLLEALAAYRGQIASPTGLGAGNKTAEAHFQGLSGPAALAAGQLDAGMSVLLEESNQFLEDSFLSALLAIAEHLAGLPGRKSIIWLTGGYYLDFRDYPSMSEKKRRLIHTLNHADVAIFPIDARGLFTDLDFNAENDQRVPFELGYHG